MTLDATAVNLARQAVEHMERMAEIAEAEAEGQWADEHDIPAEVMHFHCPRGHYFIATPQDVHDPKEGD